jgi:hypothetical protein
MAVSSYNAIGSVTLSSAQTQVTISNIPQIYTDLVVVCSLVATTATLQNAPQLRINGDAGSNYSATALNSNGTTAASGRWSNQTVIYADYYGILQNDGIGTMTAHYMNYTNNTAYKTVLIRSGKGNKETTATTALWRNTDAINSIQFITDSPNTFAAGTTFNLYGLGANQLKASGGDTILSDGTYWYHAFKSSGTFTPNSTLSCDILVVGGGGGGGKDAGGGGGAGGIFYATAQSVSSARTVIVGSGGLGATGTGAAASVGGSSTFGSLTAGVGGGGGSTVAGSNGGSGGGAGRGQGAAGTSIQTGTGGTGYGFAGGSSTGTGNAGAGGGGAGAVGTSITSGTVGKAGGVGLNTWSQWLGITGLALPSPQYGFIAGGGGGGGNGDSGANGGYGGGGAGGTGSLVYAQPGSPNTGGGGGGSSGGAGGRTGANGGSGLVIVRYAI